MATNSLRKWGEEQAALGPVKAGSYVGRADPWWIDGWSWGEINGEKRTVWRRRGKRSSRRPDWWNYSVHPRSVWRFVLATPQTAYWPSDASLHMLLRGQASWSDSVQQIFTKCLPCSWCCGRCSEVKGGPIHQESLASLCNLWVPLALWSSTSSSIQ